MRFLSTRDAAHALGLGEAIGRGLAPDGGLYVPERLPRLDAGALRRTSNLDGLAQGVIAPFASGDAMADWLGDITRDAFVFPAPVVEVQGSDGPLSVLELFHGPTAAFKDFGARFLAAHEPQLSRPDVVGMPRDLAEPRLVLGVGCHDELSRMRVRNVVCFAPRVEALSPLDAELRLQRVLWVVDSRMYDAAVATRDLAPGTDLSVDDDDGIQTPR